VATDQAVTLSVGRQLLYDDHLVADTNLARRFHKPRIHPASPVLKPETPLEMDGGHCPVACPFQDGVFYDSEDGLFKMIYHAGWMRGTALATSRDGIVWDRPVLDIDGATNRVLPIAYPHMRDGAGFWLDSFAANRDERFKLMVFYRVSSRPDMGYLNFTMQEVRESYADIYTSPDAIHWTKRGRTPPCGDNSNFYYNAHDRRWYYSLRTRVDGQRTRAYRAHEDFVAGAFWRDEDVAQFAQTDALDPSDPEFGAPPEVYNVDAVAYESITLAMLGILRGPQNPVSFDRAAPKITDLEVAFSRDGRTWLRPNREPFLACTRRPGDWNRGYLHAAGGVCIIVGDELYFYVGGFSGNSPVLGQHFYAGGSTALAVLRRDGFASLGTSTSGQMTTRPLLFSGGHLFVNLAASKGRLRVAVLSQEGAELPGFSVEDCEPIVGFDETARAIGWKTAELITLAGRPVRFRFELDDSELFAFWVSEHASGESGGYLAAGAVDYRGIVDVPDARRG
jgi:hypothetical protein